MGMIYIFLGLLSTLAIVPVYNWVDTTLLNLTGKDISDLVFGAVFKVLSSIGDGFMNIFNTAVSVLPLSDGMPTQVIYASNEVTPFMNVVNLFFPFDTVLYILSLVITIQMMLWSWAIGLKIYGYIRGYDVDNSRFNLFGGVPDHISYTDKANVAKALKSLNKK